MILELTSQLILLISRQFPLIYSKQEWDFLDIQKSIMDKSQKHNQPKPCQTPKKVNSNRSDVGEHPNNLLFNLTDQAAKSIRAKLPLGFHLLAVRDKQVKGSSSKQASQKSSKKLQLDLIQESKSNLISSQNQEKSSFQADQFNLEIHKMLSTLRKFKCSQPFKEPVNPIAMGIPQYFDVIDCPMDLQTIGKKLSNGSYKAKEDFYADIELIIKNSFTFNKGNRYFEQITIEFQKCYLKLKHGQINSLTNSKSKGFETYKSKGSGLKKTQSKIIDNKKFMDQARKIKVMQSLKQLSTSEFAELIKQMFGDKSACDLADISNFIEEDLVKIEKYLESCKKNEQVEKCNDE